MAELSNKIQELTFDQCINLSNENKSKKHLLMGNGFSIGIFPNNFHYEKLFDKIKDEKIKAIFQEFKTYDFELILLKLYESIKILKHLEEDFNVLIDLTKQIENLKSELIKIISELHPVGTSEINEINLSSCINFLNKFQQGTYFTFNYDLISYWIMMKIKEDNKNFGIDDGFRGENDILIWGLKKNINQNFFFIHGALHLYQSELGNIIKLKSENNNNLISQINKNLNENRFPLFITEGTKEHKLMRMKQNLYFINLLSEIKKINGDLFIFGHSLRDEDDHILELYIQNQNISNIFVSFFSDIGSNANEKLVNKINNWNKDNTLNNRKFYVFDSKTANVWGN